MVAPAPIPADEKARLAALHSYRILDTRRDERFDLFPRICTWLYAVPFAGINLIDADRTFFKSIIGLPSATPRRETSICAHAVGRGEALMVVEDLAQDSRFHDHPLVVKKGLRFYAGALLRSDSSHFLGTLCIADSRPRAMAAIDRQRLLELAGGVSAVLELHRHGLWLLQAATQDALTGLCNRRLFEERLQQAIALAAHGGSCALLCLDLDRFKAVNDRFGHAGGDALLREVGLRLRQATRSEDVVARLAGDEFAVLMAGPVTVQGAVQLAVRVFAAFAAPFALGGETVPIRGSIGIALCPRHAGDAAQLLRCADLALYDAKRCGRNGYQVYCTGA